MSSPYVRHPNADWSQADHESELTGARTSDARARQAMAETYATETVGPAHPAPHTEPLAHKRGVLRPSHLISTRARHETAAVDRLFRAADSLAVVVIALVVAYMAHPAGLLAAPVGAVLPLAGAAAFLAWSLRLVRSPGFEHGQTVASTLAGLASALLISVLAWAALAGMTRPPAADMQAARVWFVLSAAVVGLSQALWSRRVSRWRASGRLKPNIVIVGATDNARVLIEQAVASGKLAILGVFDDRLSRAPGDVAGVPVLGDTQALLNHRIMPYVDRVVITVPTNAQGRVRELIERLKVLPNEVSLFLDVESEANPAAALSRLAGLPLARVSGARQDDDRVLAKRMQDLVIGLLALIVAVPVMALVALAVRLDSPGPILFRQRRHGFNNEEIVVWKFRSMRHEAADATASHQVVADDERVTRVGRYIRAFSLDELPQLFNVLKGEMSLVGPRPHAIGMKTGDVESAKLVAEYAWRHRMKPGVTGWAAVRGSRGPVHTPEEVRRRVALDVDYIERQSFWFDLYILAMTLPCLILGDREAVR